ESGRSSAGMSRESFDFDRAVGAARAVGSADDRSRNQPWRGFDRLARARRRRAFGAIARSTRAIDQSG
ncbi:MAG: hypothetical protein ACKO3P_00965, partial [Planctomycetaceae bacterium]